MKVELLDEKEEFKPITLTITLESKDEAINLFNRVRLSSFDVIKTMEEGNYEDIDYPSNRSEDTSIRLYNTLHNILKLRKIIS